ncbi:hypothetical protein Ancab_007908 [Ancistrocladus abbreviatus]
MVHKSRSKGAGGGTVAKDAIGNDVIAERWLKTHKPGDCTLTQGLKNPFQTSFLCLIKSAHILGVLCHGILLKTNLSSVPWIPVQQSGKSLEDLHLCVNFHALKQSLALAHCDVDDGKVVFVPWVEEDFRTGEAPWWA